MQTTNQPQTVKQVRQLKAKEREQSRSDAREAKQISRQWNYFLQSMTLKGALITACFFTLILFSSCRSTYVDRGGCWKQNHGMAGYR